MVRAPDLHAGWRGFESLIAHLNPMFPEIYGSTASDESACEWRKRSVGKPEEGSPEARVTYSEFVVAFTGLSFVWPYKSSRYLCVMIHLPPTWGRPEN